jgi:hypothetical protein
LVVTALLDAREDPLNRRLVDAPLEDERSRLRRKPLSRRPATSSTLART